MSAYLVQFPLTVSGFGANVRYLTDIIVGRNGQEVRNALWEQPLLSFNAAFAVSNYADIATLVAFFHSVKGREQSFLLKDWSDYKVDEWTTFAETVDGSRTTFQLIKKYVQAGIGTHTRTITKPKQVEGVGGVQIRDNGAIVSTANYSFSSSTGIVTFSSAPAAGRTIDFKIDEFYVPVRFDIDELPIEMLNYWLSSGADYANVNIPEIPMKEVRSE